MHAVVALGGDADAAHVRAVLANADLVIAADGGATHIRAAGGTCDLIVGDHDSLTPAELDAAKASSVELMAFPTAKDATDGELALQEAAGRGATSITIVGALGGDRVDHLLANVALLAHPTLADVDVRIESANQRVWLVTGSSTWAGGAGDLVTLLAAAGDAHGITTQGLRYALDDATLSHATSLGVSNEMVASEATIHVTDGSVLVIHQRANPATA